MYLHENKDDFLEAIATVAAAKGITSQIVEKDYYVTLLYGFLAGIMSQDFDIETIYVDGIYSIVKMLNCCCLCTSNHNCVR